MSENQNFDPTALPICDQKGGGVVGGVNLRPVPTAGDNFEFETIPRTGIILVTVQVSGIIDKPFATQPEPNAKIDCRLYHLQ